MKTLFKILAIIPITLLGIILAGLVLMGACFFIVALPLMVAIALLISLYE